MLFVDRWMDVWKSMSVSMPFEPPFQPSTFITAIIFVVYTEALVTIACSEHAISMLQENSGFRYSKVCTSSAHAWWHLQV